MFRGWTSLNDFETPGTDTVSARLATQCEMEIDGLFYDHVLEREWPAGSGTGRDARLGAAQTRASTDLWL